MSRFPARRFPFLLLALASLALLAGCQGFSSSNSASQNSSQNQVSGGDLAATPANISFGNVQIGTAQTLSDTVTNSAGSDLTITQATVSTAAFSTSGLNLPLTLSAGQSATFSIVFTPQSAGAASGNLVLTDGGGNPSSIAISGTAVSAGSLAGNPASINFGNSLIGNTQTQTETLTNSGGTNLTISQAAISGSGFSYTGLSLPLTLSPNQSATFGVTFTPSSTGSSNGILSLTDSASSSSMDVALSGTGTSSVTPATLAAVPVSLTFTDVQMGKKQSQNATIQNTGGSIATISQISASGSGFSVSGINAPLTLAAGQSASFSVTFAPQSSGSSSGNVAISSDASNPTLNLALSGSAINASAGELTVSPATISVGNVVVGTSGTQMGTLAASNDSLTVTAVDVGSSEFSVSGLSFPVTLAAGQSANFTVTFTPQSSGAASTTLSFTSNASNSPSSATLTGTGMAAPAHTVTLGWNADNSPNVTGYNVYRRQGGSGSFSRINSTLVVATEYVDSSVTDGITYYYETTAVNSSGEESSPSSVVTAVIPGP